MTKPLENNAFSVPKAFRAVVAKSETSRAAAVKAKCLECVGFEMSEVTKCTAKDCPLWAWRPYQKRTTGVAPQEPR